MFAPLLFLPLLAPRYLLPAVPMQLLYLVSTRPAAHTIDSQYSIAMLGFAFVATAMTLRRAALQPQVLTRTLLPALVIAGLAFNAAYSHGGFAAQPWSWRHRDAVDRARLAGAQLIPRRAAVA